MCLSWFLLISSVNLKDAGNGQVEVAILDPSDSHQQIPVQIKPLAKGKYRVDYVAKQPGLHSVNVFFAGKPIPESPFGVKVAPSKSVK
jgi:filamin